ncbi:endonuclease/Exonuclease/phosphatase family protein [Hirsutella rhossiliensis]|uniref:Endonuclease/Exonuclease/phosphatase family domain-containing protein n=1 Tax=Hirsutella rhossiliensis TaxID=111463 RepID=A0A9P8N6H3_9HYPO|nr:endonuclease/Exonuclease/phosphatase family domain-containing protein [Hirsutella rhossiliensis]KAH0966866.1 endonuclease/Exonuclease/phosphatase family domain-containing protein [Hirsutella rhossiliensis]
MALLSGIRTQVLSWWQGTPLPGLPDAPCHFQAWHAFDDSSNSWRPIESTSNQAAPGHGHDGFRIVTWNVDATSPLPQMRAGGIISRALGLSSAVDVVFLQEVSQPALSFILGDARIRQLWYSSDADTSKWGGQSFGTITLLSKRRFDRAATLGPVWRVKYPSRFARDALCCDILAPPSSPEQGVVRVRLVNVHLDSLPIRPSHRPRQVSVIASLIRSAGHGLVAGDFNPVLPEDNSLVEDRGLTDAWGQLHGQDPGFTWGLDGKQPFPPGRLDKIAAMGIQVEAIEIMHPEITTHIDASRNETTGPVPWSDHSGLWCHFSVSP